jgi:hypothetical protein
MKIIRKFYFLIILVLLFSCIKKTGDENNFEDNILEDIEFVDEIILPEITEIPGFNVIFFDEYSQNNSRVMKINKRIEGQGIVVEIKRPDGRQYILWCDAFYDTKTIPYYYEIIITKNFRFNSIDGSFNIYSPDHDDWASGFSRTISEFTYDIFLDELREYLIEKEEDENHIDTIIYILSLEEDNIMSRIDFVD